MANRSNYKFSMMYNMITYFHCMVQNNKVKYIKESGSNHDVLLKKI